MTNRILCLFLAFCLILPAPSFALKPLETSEGAQTTQLSAELQNDHPVSKIAAGLEELDEPQLKKDNLYTRSLGSLLNWPGFSSESRRRLLILKKIGRQLETYIQELLNNSEIRIALVPLGSTLKGYATAQSDIDYTILILDGLDPAVKRVAAGKATRIENEAFRLMKKEGIKKKDDMQHLSHLLGFSFLRNYSEIVNSPKSLGESWFLLRNDDKWDTLYADTAVLFLPIAYGNSKLVEMARRNVIDALNRKLGKRNPVILGNNIVFDDPSFWWGVIQENYLSYIYIDPDYVHRSIGAKPHLGSWLSNQGINVDSKESRSAFVRDRQSRLYLRTFSEMAQIYLQSSQFQKGRPVFPGSGLEEGKGNKAKKIGLVAAAILGIAGVFFGAKEIIDHARQPAPPPGEVALEQKAPPEGQVQKEVRGSLTSLRQRLGPDRQIGIIIGDSGDLLKEQVKDFFPRSVRVGLDTVWISGYRFRSLSKDQQQRIITQASSAGLKTLGFIDGNDDWPQQKEFVANHYRDLIDKLSQLDLGKIRIAFATDIEPYVRRGWNGDLTADMDLTEQTILPPILDFSNRTKNVGSSPFRVGDFHGFSGVWDERGEHFELQVLGVSDPIGPALNHPDLVV
ncbi:MAG: hypothetical protein HY211_01865, partial [Candidatus Omnitrophica bacterium]|nr:hypothetical protein [Candidatus Omnitrophota bacterium]